MNLAQLKEIVVAIHGDKELVKKAEKKIDADTKSAKELRDRIVDYLDKFGTMEGDDEEDDEEDEDEESDRPEWARIGAKIEVDARESDDDDEEWWPGTVSEIDFDEETADIAYDDGTDGPEVAFHLIRAREKRPKKRK